MPGFLLELTVSILATSAFAKDACTKQDYNTLLGHVRTAVTETNSFLESRVKTKLPSIHAFDESNNRSINDLRQNPMHINCSTVGRLVADRLRSLGYNPSLVATIQGEQYRHICRGIGKKLNVGPEYSSSGHDVILIKPKCDGPWMYFNPRDLVPNIEFTPSDHDPETLRKIIVERHIQIPPKIAEKQAKLIAEQNQGMRPDINGLTIIGVWSETHRYSLAQRTNILASGSKNSSICRFDPAAEPNLTLHRKMNSADRKPKIW